MSETKTPATFNLATIHGDTVVPSHRSYPAPERLPQVGDVYVFRRPVHTAAGKIYFVGDELKILARTQEAPFSILNSLGNLRVQCKHFESIWSNIEIMIVDGILELVEPEDARLKFMLMDLMRSDPNALVPGETRDVAHQPAGVPATASRSLITVPYAGVESGCAFVAVAPAGVDVEAAKRAAIQILVVEKTRVKAAGRALKLQEAKDAFVAAGWELWPQECLDNGI